MFCERCGCMMRDGEFTCPECGAYWGPVREEEPPSLRYLILPFLGAAAASALLSWYIGFYALLFLVIFGFGGRPRTKGQMVLKGVALGLMVGCVIGLALRYLL